MPVLREPFHAENYVEHARSESDGSDALLGDYIDQVIRFALSIGTCDVQACADGKRPVYLE
jgi:hypothetical protein